MEKTIIEIQLYSPPLNKTRYAFANTTKKQKTSHEGSGLLSDIIYEKEQKEQQVITETPSAAFNYNEHILNPEDNPDHFEKPAFTPKPVITASSSKEDDPPAHGFKKLKKTFNEKVFDYSEVKQAEIEEKISQLVNEDGYYDEVLPMDINDLENTQDDIKFGDSILGKVIIIGAVAIAWLILVIFQFK